MATLVFRVSSDWEQVVKLRQECEKLEAQLKKMDVNKSPAAARALETQLASARQQMMGLVTEAAKVGATMERDFKNGIYSASQTVNNLSANITSQRGVIRQLQNELTLLKEKYRETVKSGGNTSGMSEQIKAQTDKLREQKDILFGLTQQQAEARLSVKRLKDEYAAFKEEAGETVEANEKMSVSLTKVLGVIGGVTALKNFATELVNVRGQFQQLEIAFSTMLKSKEKADKLMSELVDIAAKTPFDLQGVASSAKQMIAYGSSAENVGDELVMLGNVAAGVGSQLSEIAYLYGTLRTQGRAYAVDIRQFAGRGIPIYEELAKVLGVTKDEVSGLVKEGKVGFKEVEQAFKNMTSESGIYYNLMQEQSKSLTGQLSNLGDAWDTMLNEIGKDTQGIASAGISGLKGLIENYETVGKILIGLIATYGTYKTALIVVRIAQDTLTARMELAILVTKAQTIAQKALNTVMKANPYVLVATVLAGLVATMWAFHDSTTASEKAQQKFNEEQKNFANQEEERKKKIEELIRVIQDETETEFSKIKAYEELQRYSPALSSAYTREQLAVLNLAEANKELNKERDKNSYENILKNIQQWEEKIKSLNASLKNAGQGAPLIASQIESAKANLNKWESALSEYNRLKKETEENSKPVEVKLMEARSNREQIIREYNIARQILQEEQEKIKNFPFATIPIDVQIRFNNAQAALKGIDGTIFGLESQREASEKSYQQAYKEAKAVYEAKLKAVEDAKKGTESAYKKAVEELEAAEKSYKSLGGITGDTLAKQENDAKKDAERQKKEQQQVAEELLQLRRTNQQEEINLMEEGSEKKRRQIELDYQREIDEIRKQRKKWEDAQGGKLTSEQREVLGSRASNAMTSREKGLAEITETENQAAIEANERYLKSYGTFMQKRDAIIAEYTRKISEATTQGDKDILQKEMDKALSSLDLEKLKQGINWELIFGDLDKVSKKSLNKVKQQLRDFKNSEEYKNMAVDQKKVIDEALSNIQSTLIDKGGLLADLPEQLSELAKAQEELSQAQEEYNEAMRSGTDEQKEAATKKLNDAQKRQQNAQVNVQKSTDKTTSNLVTLSNVITQLGSNSEISLSQVGDLAGNIVDIFAEESEKLGGIIGAAFSLLDAIGTQGLDGFVGNIFSSVFKSVGGIWDTLTFGGFSKLFGIGGNEKEVQDTINRLTDRNEKLQSAIESLTEEMKSSKGSEKSVAEYNKAIKYQEEYNKNVLAKAQANAGYHSKHHSWAYYMGWSESDIQWIRENVMAEFTGTDSLWQMSPEQMDLLRQNVDLWQKMADSGKGGYGNAVVDALDEYADLAGNLEGLKEGLFEQLTGISFDSMYDSFIDTLMDMDASAEDFADNLSEYFMRAMLSDKIGNMYSQKLEDWWNRFGESMKDGNLSESERNSLQNEYMGYVNEALKLRDELAAATGYDKAGSSSKQSASSRGFGTEMTHEDAGELSGRFTAVYESNLRIETAEQQQTVAITELRGSIGSLTSQVTGLYNIADETRTILANSYLELQQIRENTGEIVKPIKQMQADIAEVKRNTARL
jgi:tape measure domain-containing protein|nr:MAG TPA: tail tape measure protein [Caudoviricetes sp.]